MIPKVLSCILTHWRPRVWCKFQTSTHGHYDAVLHMNVVYPLRFLCPRRQRNQDLFLNKYIVAQLLLYVIAGVRSRACVVLVVVNSEQGPFMFGMFYGLTCTRSKLATLVIYHLVQGFCRRNDVC